MKNKINGFWFISISINNNILDLVHAKEYGKYIESVLNLSPHTINNYLGSLERFWIWSLSVHPIKNESFPYYLSRYGEEIKTGFTIYDSSQDVELLSLGYKTQESVDNELIYLKIFFNWLSEYDKSVDLNKNTINWYKTFQKKINSKSYDYISQKTNSFALQRIIKKNTYLPKPNKRVMSIDKAFPYKYFLAFIDIIDNPRDKLLFLLIGGTSARIGQALNLTLYDIDYNTKNVYLSDPTIDDSKQKGLLQKTRRSWLLKNYNIDAKKHHPHNQLQFKYPIPSRANYPLFWINKEIKEIFFYELSNYNIYPESQRIPKHPFFFTKKNGGRWLYRPAYNSFKKNLKITALQYNEIDIDLGIHSLRHMWGNYMAELYYATLKNRALGESEKIRLYAQYGMGHSDASGTEVYFNAKIDEDIFQNTDTFLSSQSVINPYINTFYKGFKNGNR